MSIKFSCPSCSKPFTVKDQLAGKRAACPACKKSLTIPSASSAGSAHSEAHIEELAAATLRDVPAAPPTPAEEPKTAEFNCPQCDEPVRVSGDLQGKQTPCPHCGRIIKVPFRVKSDPKDWRKQDTRMPSGARPIHGPAPEGAWGSASASAVSREALLETSGPRRRPLTLRQKLLRGGILMGCVLIAAAATMIGFGWWGDRQQKQAYTKAMNLLKDENSKLMPLGRAALYTQAGTYELRSAPPAGTKNARDYFQQARKLLSTGANSLDRELLLTDLALAQIELGGDHDQAVQGVRVNWDDTTGEVRQTLQQMNDPEARAYALRKVSRRLIEKRQTDKIATLAQQLGTPKNAFNANPKAQGPSEAPELLGVAGLELFRADQKDAARKLAEDGLKLYKPDAAANPPVSASLTALCVALGMEPPTKGKAEDDAGNLSIGVIQGTAEKGEWDQARNFVASVDLVDVRWKALVALAAAAKDKPDATTLEEAIKIAAEHLRDQRQLSSWWLLHMIELAVAAGSFDQQLDQLVTLIPDPSVSGRASLIMLSAKLARTDDKVETAWAESVNQNSPSSGPAYLHLARHNASRKALSVKDVDGWEESLRPFGYLGIALGRQDAQ